MPAYKVARMVVYFLTWCFGVVASSAAINALVKTRQDRNNALTLANSLGHALYPDLVVSININDILTGGGFLAAGEVVVTLAAGSSLLVLLLPTLTRRLERKGPMMFGLGWWIFGTTWLIVSAGIMLNLVRNKSAKNSASLGGVPLPDATVKQLQAATGLSARYWIHGYGKFQAISPFPLIFFALISIVLTIMALKRTSAHGDAGINNSAAVRHSEDEESAGSPVMGEKKAVV